MAIISSVVILNELPLFKLALETKLQAVKWLRVAAPPYAIQKFPCFPYQNVELVRFTQ